ncbi:YqzE family protein [Paenibacillus sp. FSL R10-2734]|uniref:YqzE family protein n=1 Tax=Paenibacillus sp. FSL R10-2734 TaxID=2954691 RepID=UPI0030DA1B3A
MASGGDELVKYITEKVVVYIEDPRAIHARRAAATKQPWSQKWFGMLPLGWSIWRSKWSRGKKE